MLSYPIFPALPGGFPDFFEFIHHLQPSKYFKNNSELKKWRNKKTEENIKEGEKQGK